MAVRTTRRTPGVYVTELDAFLPSIAGVQTAIPAFIGYTQKAIYNGKPVTMQAVRLQSLADYESIFGTGFKTQYQITPVTDRTAISLGKYDFRVAVPSSPLDSPLDSPLGSPVGSPIDGYEYFSLEPVTDSQFNLYNSMRLFYANGGGTCYVVSVGDYTDNGLTPTGVPINVDLLKQGLKIIEEQTGPTMLVIPDAVLLPSDSTSPVDGIPTSSKFADLAKAMLAQCAKLQDRVSLLDVYGSQAVTDPDKLTPLMEQFRLDVGEKYLNYGMAYFPFLNTTVVSESDFTFRNVQSTVQLQDILSWENQNLYYATNRSRYDAVERDIQRISTVSDEEVIRLNQNLTAALPLLTDIERAMAGKEDTLPPSGAMAGVYTFIDSSRGVWNAPANISLDAVSSTTLKLNNDQQGDLNVPVDGKAVNAIREFPGRGTVVWGARTLDGNSNDWRYIQVRRTLIYVEQSIKASLDRFVFAANDGNTWVAVVSMVSNFLQGLWSQGGLLGSTASEAFTVQCGLGSTMTSQDILDGYMIVQVTLQMIRPAEFIELTFKQKMGA